LQVENVLIAGGGRKDNYLSEMITHVIADDGAEDEVTEAKELFRLPVVMVMAGVFVGYLSHYLGVLITCSRLMKCHETFKIAAVTHDLLFISIS